MCIALPRCSATVDGSGRQQFKADLELWNVFLSQWNGTSMLFKVSMRKLEVHIPQVHIMSDASGSWGCAAYWNGEWFQVAWSNHLEFEQAPSKRGGAKFLWLQQYGERGGEESRFAAIATTKQLWLPYVATIASSSTWPICCIACQ